MAAARAQLRRSDVWLRLTGERFVAESGAARLVHSATADKPRSLLELGVSMPTSRSDPPFRPEPIGQTRFVWQYE